MVKNDPSLTPILKFQHLISCLDGEAARRVSNFQVVGANFEVAWKTLETRYDNQRSRLAVQLNRLIGMKPATSKSVVEITRLLDTTNECKRALAGLGRPVEAWDDWFVQLIVYNLDAATREDWEKSLEGIQTFPSFETLAKFLENRTKSMDTARCSDAIHHGQTKTNSFSRPIKLSNNANKFVSAHVASTPVRATSKKQPPTSFKCLVCNVGHYIGYCPVLLQKDHIGRKETVDQLRLCRNCLRPGHLSTACPSPKRCRHCKQAHHSLLHATPAVDHKGPNLKDDAEVKGIRNTSTQGYSTMVGNTTLLATAQVLLCSSHGECIQVRALVDPAAEASFISEKVLQALSLTKTPLHTTVSGVGAEIAATSMFTSSLILKSKNCDSLKILFSAAVLPRLTQLLPRRAVSSSTWTHLEGLTLADPEFLTPAPVDCILGGELYPDLLLEGVRRGPANMPVAQNTRLGWIITGPVHGDNRNVSAFTTMLSINTAPSVSEVLRKFWEIEDTPVTRPPTPEEEECERFFESTHSRLDDGRYVVRLPFREQPSLPGSYAPAMRRLLSIERKLAVNCELHGSYTHFLDQYEKLQHMVEVPPTSVDYDGSYFLPHHAVVKSDGSRKLRVVFDASQATFSGRSLNDTLHSGPKLQLDISTVLTRWRSFRFAFTADIVKMFRQVLVHPDDRKWQQILWRTSPESPIKVYQLSTVTYGTACAPYLASRVLRQLADDEESRLPQGARILRTNTYVDDALAGGDTIEEALQAKQQLEAILASAGMQLDKWSANDTRITTQGRKSNAAVEFNTEDIVSTLGLRWSPQADSFHFQVHTPVKKSVVTKRTILGDVARLYDPLGWLAPVTVRAKVLLQLLWITGKDWDIPVDDDTERQWSAFCLELPLLERLHIPRWFGIKRDSTFQLHGFADASEKAYAAVVYLIIQHDTSASQSTLIAAKSKVAPIKTLSIPRLELCGAALLAKLLVKVQDDLGQGTVQTYCWTDSQVVLAWLQGRPGAWHTFVANRVSQILTIQPDVRWGHVRSAANPADLATRGLTPAQLLENQLWWHGPTSIFQELDVSTTPKEFTTSLEKRNISSAFHAAPVDDLEDIIKRFSSFNRLIKVMSFVFRWLPSTRRSSINISQGSPNTAELEATRLRLITRVQQQHYQATICKVRDGTTLSRADPLRRLAPFLDENGLLRVGGRLQFSHLTRSEKHPLLIPRHSYLAELLIRQAHEATLHGGPQLMQSHLLRSYWIPQSRNKIRSFYRNCVRCTRFSGRTQEQFMAPLPSSRVTPARPFHVTGLDYAGPFRIRTSKGRGQHSSKGYVAIFTCFSTKAVHIEVVSDYSSKTFLLAFRRFVARRGLCHTIVTDNGTTFQGADAELRRAFLETSSFSKEVADSIKRDGVTWSYIPPRAPHFGGLWEAAVKCFKHHLKRVVGDAALTFEEFTTLSASIEACLNSRPLSPLSSDPSDMAALTPGHFLVGTALTAPPEPFHVSSDVTGIPRWKITTQMRNHFWRRWRKEVLNQMQQRSKWLVKQSNLNLGDLVLLYEKEQPPLKWPLGRIEALHPGSDGLARVATIRTATTRLKRPLTKLIRLPVNEVASAHFTSLKRVSGDM